MSPLLVEADILPASRQRVGTQAARPIDTAANQSQLSGNLGGAVDSNGAWARKRRQNGHFSSKDHGPKNDLLRRTMMQHHAMSEVR